MPRIKAILLEEFYLLKRTPEVYGNLLFSLMAIIIFGLFTDYLSTVTQAAAAKYLLLGLILFEIMRHSQYTVSVGSLWHIWSRNLNNVFASPITTAEYLFGYMLSGFIKALIVFIVLSLFAAAMLDFNIFKLGGLNLVLFFLNLSIFAWSFALLILGLIFRYGAKAQALAWGAIFLIQPLTAVFVPVDVLPPTLQKIAYVLPPTYVFEAARAALEDPAPNWPVSLLALTLNLFYFLVAAGIFWMLFKKSKQIGQFARLEG